MRRKRKILCDGYLVMFLWFFEQIYEYYADDLPLRNGCVR